MVKAETNHPRSIAVLSGKGGTGKTHIAVNLAVHLAREGRRVLLIDTDLGSANAGLRLNLSPKNSLIDYYEGKCDLWKCVTRSGYGFDIIACMPGHFQMANMSDEQVILLLKAFESLTTASPWDEIIFDLGAGISNRTIDFGIVSDEIMIVCVPNEIIHGYAVLKACWTRFCEVQSIDYLSQRADMTKTPYFLRGNYTGESGGPRINFVVNQAETPEQGKKVFLRVTQVARDFFYTKDGFWKLPVRYLGSLPVADDFMRHSEKQRLPAVVMNPYHPFSVSLGDLARVLLAKQYQPAGKIKIPIADRIKGVIANWRHR